MMDNIPPFWAVGDTHFTRGYRPQEQAVVILATRRYKDKTACVEHFIGRELFTHSRVDAQAMVDVVTVKMLKALDHFIEGETDANTSD